MEHFGVYENEETAIVLARAVAGGADIPNDRMLWAIENVWHVRGEYHHDRHTATCDLVNAIEDEIEPFCEGEWENPTTIAFDIIQGGWQRHQKILNEIAAMRSLEEICEEIAGMLD